MSVLQLTTSDAANPRTVSILAGVMRRLNNKWVLLDDAGHAPIGLKTDITEPTPHTIEVKFDKKYHKVLTCSITPDETYARNGFIFGGSCLYDRVVIHHSKNGVQSTNSQLSISGSNIWISIMMFD
jgi:hypothetical protein